MTNKNEWGLWSSKLSPFGIKIDALLRQANIPFIWLPEEGSRLLSLQYWWRLNALKRGRRAMTWPPSQPEKNKLRELPAVPYLFGPEGENLYDSTAIGEWLVLQNPSLNILPPVDTAEGFMVRLIDESLDEFGLYIVHHNRWVHAATDNNAGERLAAEMRPLLGPLSFVLRVVFPRRQTRRLPYLFSVAGGDSQTSVGSQAPGRKGFPPTHQLLDQAFCELLSALEPIFSQRPYLSGDHMTLADASILGQLGMNKTDPSAWKLILEQAPHTALWVERNYLCNDLREVNKVAVKGPVIFDDLQALLGWCCRYFVPLMQQNYCAYLRHKNCGETLFNEAAFDRQRALYEGEIANIPFKSVVKTFQVLVWENVQETWEQLPAVEKNRLDALLPKQHGLDTLTGSFATGR